MDERFSIKNSCLKLEVKKTGAELCSVQKLPDGTEMLWDANPLIWTGHAPVLFPIVGALREGSYFYKGKKYDLPQHGFFRKNNKIELVSSTADSLCFGLFSSPETLKHYPFQFEFLVSYTLKENSIIVNHEVKNTGDESMFFSLGGHPAFKCPIDNTEKYTDYYLEFSDNEEAYTYQIVEGGLIGSPSDLVMNNSNRIDLHDKLFDKGALVFKNLNSRSVSLISRRYGKCIQLDYEGFPYLGIWAKPKANFVCLEPWLGIADSVDASQQLETKEGIISLAGKSRFSASYRIRVF